MKILIVMTGFFPGKKFGGPPVSVDNFCTLMSEHECFIVTRNHDMGDKKTYQGINDGWNDRGNCKVKYFSDHDYKESGYKTFENAILEIKPDAIYLQGLFQDCIIPCLFLAKKYKLGVLLAPRGELNYGAFHKKYKKIPYILFLKIFGLIKVVHFQSTSDEETKSIKKWLGVEANRIHYLANIPSIPKEEYPLHYKEKGSARIVFLSRIHPKKNLLFAIHCLQEIKGDLSFDIYGPIEDKEYWIKCSSEIEKLPSNITVNYCGLVDHDQVHSIFSNYDAFLFPTLSENFGHVIAEALMVGCPVIISNRTPFSCVNEYKAGWAIDLNLKKGFIDAIASVINNTNEEQIGLYENALDFSKKYFALDKQKNGYNNVIKHL